MIDWVFSKTEVFSVTFFSTALKKLYIKVTVKGCDIQKFWMCTASSVRQWGLSVKEKYGNFFESPGKDPRVEWAACCNSEVPLFGGAGAEAGLRMLLEAPQLWVEHCMSWAAVLFFYSSGF